MFVRPKAAEQEEARRLRAEGRSLRQIAAALRVSLASASSWTRDIPVPTRATPAPPTAPTETAYCTGCDRTLAVAHFHRGQSRCKDCRRAYIQERGDLHRRQSRVARDRRRALARAYVVDLLTTGACADCGVAEPAVLEFDHVGNKTMEVGKLVREAYRLERVKSEIANCELVCANCHRRRTALRARSWRIDPDWRAGGEARPLRRRNLLFIVNHLRAVACADCGERDSVVLDFDHVGMKRNGVVQLAYDELSIASLEREIGQCEIRCANCHRRRTIIQQRHFRHHLTRPP